MTTVNVVLGIILILAAIFLVIAVLFQSGKSQNLSGAIAGASETFFGKNKGKTADKVLARATTVVAIVFVLLVIVIYVIQTDNFVTKDSYIDDYIDNIGNENDSDKTTDTAEKTSNNESSDTADDTASDTTESNDSGESNTAESGSDEVTE